MRRVGFSLQDLPAWCALNNVSFHKVKIQEIEDCGHGLVAEADLPHSGANSVLEIPQDLVLSAQAVEDYAKIDKNFRDLLEKAGHQVSCCSLSGNLDVVGACITAAPDPLYSRIEPTYCYTC